MEKEKMNSKPLVSVIMPLYNAEKYVGEAIQSIIDQTYTNWELIIVNDGSTDNSLAIAKQYQSDKIKVFSQENKGASAARNYGYYQSCGDFVKFFDADDLISSNMLEQQVNKLVGHPNSIVSAQWGRFYNNDISTFKLNIEECWKDMDSIDWICSSWRSSQPMLQPGIFLIPREIIEKAGAWDERLSLIDDFECLTRLILASQNIKFANEASLKYRSGVSNALSGQKSRKAVESAFLSISLGASTLLSMKNNSLTRLCSANIWQGFVYEFYHLQPDLGKLAEKKLRELGGSDYKFPSGGITKILASLLGWKMTSKIKSILFLKSFSLTTPVSLCHPNSMEVLRELYSSWQMNI
ncbi:MAG: glycosyltransferase family 2 protein [Cytophagales bacterium]